MGKLVKQSSGPTDKPEQTDSIWLFREHTIGRDPRCNSVLSCGNVSRFHARISWSGNHWTIKDLGSKNGTFINGRKQQPGEMHQIYAGDKIIFGDRQQEYLLVQDLEPMSCLITSGDDGAETLIPLVNLLPLPSEKSPLCTIFSTIENRFTMEDESGAVTILEHGMIFRTGKTLFEVVFAKGGNEIKPTSQLESNLMEPIPIHLDIAVAPDEESAEVTLQIGNTSHTLQPKVHLYLLAHLARIRASQTVEKFDSQKHILEDGNGWVDCNVICDDLLINREHLAQQVFRVRQDFKKCDPVVAERIIDRRLRGKVRIGFPANSFNIRTMF
ncbi:FHA domain-containing protein [Desulfogranum japonicum]|uniref:FHA domain-containing protein n=1 Tax=Desulfogranum japonicum TaxID=231447 RepID=UPI00040B14B4|nr:FHA domain-containing protein [Desulfogranum japonicum]